MHDNAGMPPAPPSGDQHVLRHGDQTAVAVELGGGLRAYSVGDRRVLDGFSSDEPAEDGRGQVLVPWPNRIRDGSYEWDGERHHVPINEPDRHNAIHGLLRQTPWLLLDRAEHRVRLGATISAQPGYPFELAVAIEYELGPAGLAVRVTAENRAARHAPYGFGQHPYLTVGTDRVDESVLVVPASVWLRTDERGIPVTSEPVEGTDHDFRKPRRIGAQQLDTAYTALIRGADGRAVVRLAAPEGDRGIDLWLARGLDYLQVFTGDTAKRPERRRRSLAVEPMTCAPNAFQTGDGVVALPPGGRHEARWGITPW